MINWTSVILEYIDEYYLLLFLEVTMFVLLLLNRDTGSSRARRGLAWLMGICLILSIARILDLTFGDATNFPESNIYRAITSYIGYVLGPASEFAFLSMALKGRYRSLMLKVLMVPLFLNALLYMAILWQYASSDPLVVGFSTNNAFTRGPLGFTSHILSGLYIVFIVLAGLSGKRGHRSHDSAILMYAALGCTVAICMETYGDSNHVLYPTILASGLIYYLFLYMRLSRVDPLTGIYNRHLYYFDCEDREKVITGMIAIDMNGLKRLNDEEGHDIGDRGLKMLAELFERCGTVNSHVYRVGGDEFAILCYHMSEAQIRGIADRIYRGMESMPYSASLGIVIRDKGESLAEMRKRADRAMYDDKRDYYERTGIERRNR